MNTQPLDLVTYTDRLFQAVTAGDDYSTEVDLRQAEIEAAGVNADDVYELGDSLQKRGGTLHECIALAINTGLSWQDIGDLLIQPELDAIKKNRALNEALNSMDAE